MYLAGAMGVAGVGAVTDIANRRIPNWLTYSGMLAAMVGHALQGWRGLESAITGGLISGGIMLVFFLVHAMGAGDVKLMTAIGCLVGPKLGVEILLATAIAGGIFAIVLSLWQGKLRAVLVNVIELIQFHAVAGAEVHPTLNLSNPQATRMPYGVAIVAGVLYSALAFYRRGGI
jgi:prepilin peptidase CpaA